jgi:hypothetical protein
MRNALMALCAASLCALAAPAMAQEYSTVPDNTGAPLYSYRHTAPQPAAVGSCEILSGNRVCTATPAGYGAEYGYGYGPAGELIAAPVAIVTAPFGFFGGPQVASSGATYAPATGTGTYSYESHVPPQPGAVGYCDIISGNRVCF